MGRYMWSSESPMQVITIVILLITLLTTAHEPPSSEPRKVGTWIQELRYPLDFTLRA